MSECDAMVKKILKKRAVLFNAFDLNSSFLTKAALKSAYRHLEVYAMYAATL